eukprot:gb/GFBE01042104.1/.p1 GENE.gb/GFBE01042104.1/~~gb/GFBE01042104.1/.p1  ORF type:complete len:1026 (+),score=358.55 gb/GFBE01042104.1/:1-3078(+)
MPPKKKLKGEDGEAVVDEEVAEEEVNDEVAQLAATPKTGMPFPPLPPGQSEAEAFEPEGPTEPEEDAKEDSRAKITAPPCFQTPDTTLNVHVSTVGNVLMMLNEGGLNYLMAGARANVGIKSGRYMFEVKILELLNPVETGAQLRTPMPKHVLRIGFSTAKSMPLMGDTEESICFDSEGSLFFNRKRTPIPARYGPDCTIAVVLNLDQDSPHANTISLFKDGWRCCDPQPLPDALKGKALFPTVTYKNMNLHANFGPAQLAPLPFKCRMVQEAAIEDVEVVNYQPHADGKYELIFPVCLPEEGTFDWLDWFLERNPNYVELSERMIIEWAVRSGINRPRVNALKASNDRPDMNFGMPHLDDGITKQILVAAAATQERDMVFMEVRGNLLEEERKEAVARFRMPHFKRVAKVMMGEPTGEFRQHVLEQIRKEKQEKADVEFQAERQRKAQMRLMEMQKKQVEWAKKQQEKRLKRAAEEAKRRAEAAAAIAAGETPAEEPQAMEEDEEQEPAMEAEEEEEPPRVELTEEEKQQWFRKTGQLPDLTGLVLSHSFPKFTVPTASEGFDEIDYAWQPAAAVDVYLKKWIHEHKITTRIDDLTPSEWFKERWQRWQKDLQNWHVRHMEFKDPAKRAAILAARKKEKEGSSKQEEKNDAVAAEKKEEKVEEKKEDKAEEKKGEDAAENLEKLTVPVLKEKLKAEGLTVSGNKAELIKRLQDHAQAKAATVSSAKEADKKEDEKKEEKTEGASEEKKAEKVVEEEPEPTEAELMKDLEEEINAAENDVFEIEDVMDVGTGEPLFCNFTFEDWALLSLRFEMHLLSHSFLKDCGDPERAGIYPDHLTFYYNKYYKKALNPKNYGVDGVEDLLGLIRDTIVICHPKVVESQLTSDLETNEVFVKLTEEARRDRQRRLDSGDESAQLKFAQRPAGAAHAANPMQAAGSKAPTLAGTLAAKGYGKGGMPVSQPQTLLHQQQRQQQLRQQMQQQMQQTAPVVPGVPQARPWMQQGGGMFGMPLAQRGMMARPAFGGWN